MGTNEMKWHDYLKMAREEATDWIEDSPDAEPGEVAHEIADSCIPVYTHTILKLGLEHMDLAIVEPELGPAFDGKPTPVNIIAANIYEALYSEAYEAAQKAIAEAEDKEL